MTGSLIDKFDVNSIEYALLKSSAKSLVFLVKLSDVSEIGKIMKELGFRKRKSPSKDIYMYGMNDFVYFQKMDFQVIFQFQISCKSSLHGEWIPLDRVVNVGALERRVKNDTIYYLNDVDYLCYLLADSVYTEGTFAAERSKLIYDLYEKVDKASFNTKLEKIFFKFSRNIISLIQEKKLDMIIDELFRFSDY